MAESQSWQTVKGGKAVKKEPARKKKKKEQSFIPVLLQDAPPVREDNTKFSAYNAPPTPPPLEESPPAPPATQVVPDAGKQTQPKHKPPRKAEKKGKEDSLPSAAEVLRNLNATEIEDCFNMAKSRFGRQQSSWLRDLAQHVRNIFTRGTPDILNVSQSFWSSNIPPTVSQSLRLCYRQCQPEALDAFYATCLDALATELHSNGYPAAYQLFMYTLQCYQPNVIGVTAKQLKVNLEICLSLPREAIALLRSALPLPECGHMTTLAEGFDVCCQVMLPHYISPANVPRDVLLFAITYLQQVCSSLLAMNETQAPSELTVYDNLIAFLKAPVPRQLASERRSMIPLTMKSVADVCSSLYHPLTRSSLFLEGFMLLDGKLEEEAQKRVLRFLVGCVVVCEVCRQEWMDRYTDHLSNSGALLSELVAQKPSKDLKELLMWMKEENGRLVDRSTPAAALCCGTVEALLIKCDKGGDSDVEETRAASRCCVIGQTIIGHVFVLLVFALIVDICWHQGWTGCITYSWLASLGVTVPPLSFQPVFSFITRSLRDLGVPENWLAMWLNLVYVLEMIWTWIVDLLFQGARMYKHLYFIVRHTVIDYLAQTSLQDYLHHFFPTFM